MKTKTKEAMDALTLLGVGAGGAVLSSFLVNGTPGVKTANPATKSFAQLGIGMAIVMFAPGRFRLVRYAGMGMAWAGALGAVERVTKMKTLAGDNGTLSASEIRQLQAMGAYANLAGPATMQRMHGPVSLHNPMAGRPSMMGGFKAPS